MLDWLHGLPFVWLVVVVFGVTYLVAAAISWVVLRLAVGENARTFKAVSPGLLPPLGRGLRPARRLFSQCKSGMTMVKRRQRSTARRAHYAPSYSWAGASRPRSRPGCASPASLAEALRLALALRPHSEGQKVAQREMVVAVETALDARPGARAAVRAVDSSLWHDPRPWTRLGSRQFRSLLIFLRRSSTSSRPR